MPATYASTKEIILGQKVGDEIVKIHPETCISQVKAADGTSLADKLSAIEGAVSGQSGTSVVADIAARDAIASPKVGDQCWVIDATGDETVKSGGAKYIYESADKGWVKTAEAESMDVTVNWTDVAGKPDASAGDIAEAVAQAHEHANKTDLDKMSVVNGQVAVDGTVMKSVMYAATLPDAVPADLVDGGFMVIG